MTERPCSTPLCMRTASREVSIPGVPDAPKHQVCAICGGIWDQCCRDWLNVVGPVLDQCIDLLSGTPTEKSDKNTLDGGFSS